MEVLLTGGSATDAATPQLVLGKRTPAPLTPSRRSDSIARIEDHLPEILGFRGVGYRLARCQPEGGENS